MQSESKQNFTPHDVGDVLSQHQSGGQVAPICTRHELKNHSPKDATRIDKTRRLHEAKWLPLALLLYLFIPWTQLGGRLQLFPCSKAIPQRLAFWHCQSSSPKSDVTCPYLRFLSFQAWLTEQHSPRLPSNRSLLAQSNHWDGQTTS